MKTAYQQNRSTKHQSAYQAHLDGIEDMVPQNLNQPRRLNGDFAVLAFGDWDITSKTDWEGLGA